MSLEGPQRSRGYSLGGAPPSPKRRAERERLSKKRWNQKVKRVSRKRLMVAALFIVTIAYLAALYHSVQLHNAWRQAELEKYPPDVQAWIDLPPFSYTTIGLYFMFSGFALAWSWAILFIVTVHHRVKPRKVVACLFLTALFMASACMPLVAAGYYEKTIDVLVVEDEEFRGLSSVQRYWWYQTLNNVAFSNFKTYYGVEFKIRGYVEWDSEDACHDLYYLLDEAISEVEYSFRMAYGDYYIDLLMVFTGQEDPVLWGLSPPEWYALILEYWIGPAKVMVHELGHQFLLEHCNNDCAMNPASLVAGYFCSSCGQQVKDNYEPRFWRYCCSLTISSTSGGTTSPSPGTYEHDGGTSVTVTACPNDAYELSYWVLDGTTHYGSPITVTMNSDHTLKAYFQHKQGGAGGRCMPE